MKNHIKMLILTCGVVFVGYPLFCLPRAENAGSIERISPALDAVVPQGAALEKVASGFTWTEGPVWIHAGYLLFAEIPSNRILKWMPDGQVTTFLYPSGYQGSAPYGGPEPGTNGMTLDRRGRLTVAGHARRNVFRLESLAKGGKMTVLAERFQGKRLNSPNDVVYAADGALYFTDPPYGLPTQSDKDSWKELSLNGVYRIPAAAAHAAGVPPDDAKLQLVIKDLTRPNGLALSPDGKTLYVAVSDPNRKVWMRYDVKSDGSVAGGRVFFDVTSNQGPGLPDGMKVDQAGNLYGTGPGGVWIFSPGGKHLGTIRLPKATANCHWGDADGKTLYLTSSSDLYRIRLKIAGVRP